MAGEETAPPDRTRRRWAPALRREVGWALELAALVGFAVVQPVLGPFGESPETFTGVEAGPGEIVLFALSVALVPILGLWALGAATRLLGPRVRPAAQTVLVALLAAAAASGAARQSGGGEGARAAAAIVAATAAAVIHRRWEPGRRFLRYASPVPVVLVAFFVFASPVSTLVRPASVEVDARPAGDHPPVVFIVLDELPTLSLVDGEGGIDAQLYPNIARLAGTSTWYRDHTSVTSATQTSVPALLTGRITPDAADQRAATHTSYPDNLITLLAETHDVHGQEWATEMCPRSLCPERGGDVDEEAEELLARQLAETPDPLDALTDVARTLWWSQVWPAAPTFDAEQTIEGKTEPDDLSRVVLEFLSGIEERSGDRPAFEYLHAPLPHVPWRILPTGETHDAPDPPFGAEFLLFWPPGETGADLADAARTRHLLQLQWTDRLLGAVIARLQRVGLWDDAVVVVTSDHGVAFEPGHHMRVVDPETVVPLAWSPLFIKEPGQEDGQVVDDSVSALDVVPTVAELVGIDVDWEVDGESLVGGVLRGARPKPLSVNEPEAFEDRIEGNLVALGSDGLDPITSTAARGRDTDDDLRVWRHGRHGALLGRAVDDLGVCDGRGASVDVERSPTWSDYLDGTLPADAPRPLWRQGTVEGDEDRDVTAVAAVVDDVVVGWSTVQTDGSARRFGLLLAEPLVRSATGDPAYFEVVDDPGCRLRPLAT
ncbi:sulfatase-like hydrolase/transferase [Iamia sp. SCSIO 61187]|uniref:sulfatase-like hydrolase/transferase n=1 Tax=Iamia sp. SCSIO 61187 TaxID=2722752 RepID=UPI001C6397FC|nr:sulfatase-like hydrolase/transferase [Iamia sp. SCSIO 61187]QYG91209.1 sulfatase-like hydrolase/transferase [Iamia sp. SCSIO 61187]